MRCVPSSERTGRQGGVALAALLLAAASVAVVGCRPRPAAAPAEVQPTIPDTGAGGTIARGSVIYAAYCAGCHGVDGMGGGPVATMLGLHAANLRSPALQALSDDALVARVLTGEPLDIPDRRNPVSEDLQVDALVAYVPTLGQQNWEQLRVGRVVYESECAPCHGVYGYGEGALAGLTVRRPADLQDARRRYTDAALAEVAEQGIGAMPPSDVTFAPVEQRALVAYVRHLSRGYRLYDTYCAGCHGDDGAGLPAEDVMLPAVQAPPLRGDTLARLSPGELRTQVQHMLARERGRMPHFRGVLDAPELHAVFAYLRTGDGGSAR